MWPWANHWNFPSAHWFLCLQNSCKGTSWGRIRRKVTKWRQLLWVLLAKVLLQMHTRDSRKQRPYKCKITLICTSSPCACQGWRWELCFFFLFWASLSTCNLIPTVFPVIISFLLYLSPLLTLTLSELTCHEWQSGDLNSGQTPSPGGDIFLLKMNPGLPGFLLCLSCVDHGWCDRGPDLLRASDISATWRFQGWCPQWLVRGLKCFAFFYLHLIIFFFFFN